MRGIILVLILQMITFFMWWVAKGAYPTTGWEQSAAQVTGLLGMMSLCISFVLAVRTKWIEKLFGGLDKTYKTHHIVGGLSFVFLLNHVLFLIVSALPRNTLSLYLWNTTNLAYTLGQLALYLLLFLIALTIYVKLPYRYWKWSHEWMGFVIILGGLHSMLITSDTSRYLPIRYWIMIWGIVASLSFLYKRFGYYYFPRPIKYKVIKGGKDKDLYVVSLESIGEPIEFEGGQYGFFSLPGRKREEHAFSILGNQNRKLYIGLKVMGEFTTKLSNLKPGDEVLVRGPYGMFGQKLSQAKHAIWIAGGIGITPFLSLAKSVRVDQKVEMYFCARVMPAKVITEPFARLAERNSHFFWHPCETSKGGHLTGKQVFEETGSDLSAYYMLCGPKQMMEGLAEQLAQIGVKRSHIVYEDFAFK